MANSKFMYVKSFELEDKIFPPNIIVLWIAGHKFQSFSDTHKFSKPNDEHALKLMESCASSVSRRFPEVVFSYGFGDEHSFVLRKKAKLYQRRSSKILSVITSFFTSVYVGRWAEFFPGTELKHPPSFRGRLVVCPTTDVLQQYLAWRQCQCHLSNQYHTCFWELVRSGMKEADARETLKSTRKRDKNEILFQRFQINYNNVPRLFRWGSCVFTNKDDERSTTGDEEASQKGPVVVYAKHIAGRTFWNSKSSLVKDLGSFETDIGKVNPEHIDSFLFERRLLPSTWIVVRIDGCNFRRFADLHGFEKPNDRRALMLMNSCAVSILEEYKDIVMAYGTSDEYSFVLKKESELYERRSGAIFSSIVSLFTALYLVKWRTFMGSEIVREPYFDGRVVCYPSVRSIRDYLSWRQVDTHINNQYNSCFWRLVMSGRTKREAQFLLKGTQSNEKMLMLETLFGVNYNDIEAIVRMGSSVFWVREDGEQAQIVVEHCNIIEDHFWDAHPTILDDRES